MGKFVAELPLIFEKEESTVYGQPAIFKAGPIIVKTKPGANPFLERLEGKLRRRKKTRIYQKEYFEKNGVSFVRITVNT